LIGTAPINAGKPFLQICAGRRLRDRFQADSAHPR